MKVKRRRRPVPPSAFKRWLGPFLVVAALVGFDVVNSLGYRSPATGLVILAMVVFVSCWSGLWPGIVSAVLVGAYAPVAYNIPGSAVYHTPDLLQKTLGNGIVFLVIALIAGVVQDKLRAAAVREFDAQEAVERELEQRKRAESELLESEVLRGIVVESAMDAVIAIDEQGIVSLWNPSAERIFGWTSEKAHGRRLSELIVPEAYRDQHEEGLARFRESQTGTILGQRLELSAVTHEGKEIDVELTVVPHRAEKGTTFVGFVRDVTQERRIQKELAMAQRLESVGQLAGGVAHDFNNVLSVIVGYGELAKAKLVGNEAVQKDLDEIIVAARRCFEINNQLLAFARRQVMAPRVVSLNEVIGGLMPMLRTLVKENIELSFTEGQGLAPVKIDPGQVEQMLTNLAVNARDAMPEGGRLMVETRTVSVGPDDDFPVPDLGPGDYSTVSVTDTGTGIAPEHIDRIFEPFFTTKEDKGTGLGLASAYGIVKRAGGRIAVYSEVGHGTMFRIYLPAVSEAVEGSPERTVRAPANRGHERVLVAEDNDQVRAVIEQALQYFGYSVTTARSGEDALAKAEEMGSSLDLLVTDLIMPRMGGTELAKRLREKMPGLKVLFLSGYTEESVSPSGVEGIGGAFLQKPVLPSDLAAKVREVLDESLVRD